MKDETIIISGPKRSGTTLLNRLFDSHPNLLTFLDEAYFWEHVYDYDEKDQINLLITIFNSFDGHKIYESLSNRDLLPWINGLYTQRGTAVQFSKSIDFDVNSLISDLDELKYCKSVSEIWQVLVRSYFKALDNDLNIPRSSLIKTADYGKTILSARKFLNKTRNIFIIRNPFYAIDSLKKSRQIRKEKILHPINFAEVLSEYLFFWNHKDDILREDTLLIKYEDLVINPKEIMNDVANHLDICFEDSLMNPSLNGEAWSGLSSFQDTKGIDASVLERGIDQLEEQEIKVIEKMLEPLLKEYNYIEKSS